MLRFWQILAHLGVGLIPGPRGTWGSVLGLVLFILIHRLWPPGVWILLGLSVVLGTVAAGRAEEVYGKGGKQIIIDEVAGQTVALLFAPLSWPTAVAAFFLFRLFDILKPWPASAAERLPGGAGVMADDLVAGLMAGIVLRLAWMLLH